MAESMGFSLCVELLEPAWRGTVGEPERQRHAEPAAAQWQCWLMGPETLSAVHAHHLFREHRVYGSLPCCGLVAAEAAVLDAHHRGLCVLRLPLGADVADSVG